MRYVSASILLLVLAGCGDDRENEYAYTPTEPANPATIATEASYAVPTPYAPPTPSHYYDERDGVFYSYIAAVSEEDQKSGKRAGDVVTYAYLGEEGGRHILARVSPSGSVLARSSCRNPCRVITYDNGDQLGYDERSIIGAAFADAIAGKLEVACYEPQPRWQNTAPTVPPPPSSLPTPTPKPPPAPAQPTPFDRAEQEIIARWQELDRYCQQGGGQAADACRQRDTVLAPQLAAANICYGAVYQSAADKTFHRCGNDSYRFGN